jgi:twitching motility two-component system response regulator PilG
MRLEINQNTPETSKKENFAGRLSVETDSAEMLQFLRNGIEAAKSGNRNEARILLMRVAEAEPKNETAWLWLASISEYPEELLVFLQNVLNVNPENKRAIEWTKQTKSLLAKNVVQRGIAASQENQKAIAKQCFMQAIAHDNQNEMAWLWLASIVDSAEEKISHLKKVLNINPENETAISSLKLVKNQMAQAVLKKANQAVVVGDRDTARNYLHEAMKHDDKCEEVWLLKAHLADSFDEKVGHFSKVLEINPNHESARAGLVSIEAVMKSVIIQPKKAEVHLKEDVETFSQKEIQHSIEESFAKETTAEAEEENLLGVSGYNFSVNQEPAVQFEQTVAQEVIAETVAETEKQEIVEEEITAQTEEVHEVTDEFESENIETEQQVEAELSAVTEELKEEAEAKEEISGEEAQLGEVETANTEETLEDKTEEFAKETVGEFVQKLYQPTVEEHQEEFFAAETQEVVAEENSFEETVAEEQNFTEAQTETEEYVAESNGEVEIIETETVVKDILVEAEVEEQSKAEFETSEIVEEQAVAETAGNHFSEEVSTEVEMNFSDEVEQTDEILPENEAGISQETNLHEEENHGLLEFHSQVTEETAKEENVSEAVSETPNVEKFAEQVSEISPVEEVAEAPIENEIGFVSLRNFNPHEALKEVGTYSFTKLKPEELPREVNNYAFLKVKTEETQIEEVKTVSVENRVEPVQSFSPAYIQETNEPKVEMIAAEAVKVIETVAETKAEPEVEIMPQVKAVVEPQPTVKAVQAEKFDNHHIESKVENTWESFESKVEAMVEKASHGKHEVQHQVCPFCRGENDVTEFMCYSCQAFMTLTDLDTILGNDQVNTGIVFEAIQKKELEKLGKEFTEEDFQILGLAYLNVQDLQNAHENLKLALHLNPMSVELNSLVNNLAEKNGLREEKRQVKEKAERKVNVSHTILVVDDSPTVRKLISTKLERHGHTVVAAVDGMDALAKINEVVPDLILLDITMPRLDGYQVCKLIRNNDLTKTTPIVMISGKDGFFDKVRGRMAGSTDFISKPFGPEILMKMLDTYIH